MTTKISEEKLANSVVFTQEQLVGLNWDQIPKSVAVIMDGNRRWAAQNNLPIQFAYVMGAQQLKKVVRAAVELGIQTLIVYAFSTENWKRPQSEIENLLTVFKNYLIEEKASLLENRVRLATIGDTRVFPSELQNVLKDTLESTKDGSRLNLVLALNYGARDEIKRAVTCISKDCLEKKIKPSDISEKLISKYLDTAIYSDPDLLIRTSGESRLSNFLLWQASYAEICLLEKFWPEFEPEDLLNSVKQYQQRESRRGI